MNPVVVCILLSEWTTVEVTTFGLFLFGEGDFKFLGVWSAEVGGGDGEEVEGRGHEGGVEYLPDCSFSLALETGQLSYKIRKYRTLQL